MTWAGYKHEAAHIEAAERAAKAAEHVLEKIMLRQRWTVETRDRLAEYLLRYAQTEIVARRK